MENYDVVVVGGGPVGLMLGCELRLAGVEVLVLEKLAAPSGESRAGGMHARTMEVLDQRGMLEPFLAAGRRLQGAHFSGFPLHVEGFATRYPYLLVLLQREIERLLEAHARAVGVVIRREAEVVGLAQDAEGVEVRTATGGPVRARYAVGCDGGRSLVRRLAGIGFPGTGATLTALLGDVELRRPPGDWVFQVRRMRGNFSVLAFEQGWYRVTTNEFDHVADRDAPVTFEELRETMLRIAGDDFGMHSPRWVSRYSDAARQADRYRAGRVLLAGDAAHIHFPAGGQGLNTGVQDAMNLGWKLGAVLRGEAGDELLDSYHAERHPVAARVLRNTRAQTALTRPGAQTDALRETVGELISIEDANERLGLMITALDVRYDLGDDHPVLGFRVPDADLVTGDRHYRLYELLHAGRPVFLNLGGADLSGPDLGGARLGGVAEDWVDARPVAPQWSIPGLGTADVPGALLVRPDGHIAWAADGPRHAAERPRHRGQPGPDRPNG
jgi:3-(3-hydroxy-phenyl)propionate hydroxylase